MHHLPAELAKAHDAQEVARADSLLTDVRSAENRSERLYGAAEDILDRALEAKDLKTALNAIRAAVSVMGEARQYMELRGELSGELGRLEAPATNNVVNLLVMPMPTDSPRVWAPTASGQPSGVPVAPTPSLGPKLLACSTKTDA